jgi:hypothetical protein
MRPRALEAVRVADHPFFVIWNGLWTVHSWVDLLPSP